MFFPLPRLNSHSHALHFHSHPIPIPWLILFPFLWESYGTHGIPVIPIPMHISTPVVKFRKVISASKVMVSVFWDSEGVLLTDYLEKGKTVTGMYYAGLIRKLREVRLIKEKRRGKLTQGVLLHHDNTPAHTSHVATATIHDCGFELH